MLIALQISIADFMIQWWLCFCKAPAKRCLCGAAMQRSMLWISSCPQQKNELKHVVPLRQVISMKPAQDEQRTNWLGGLKAVARPY